MISQTKHNILIIGGSGYIGNTIYTELRSYFKTTATYFSQEGKFKNNQSFYYFDIENSSLDSLLKKIQPSIIIGCFKGPQKAQIKTYKILATYVEANRDRLLFYISTHKVFDALYRYPSTETDKPASISEEGKQAINIEKTLLNYIPKQTLILRIPLILGVNSPLLTYLRKAIRYQADFELYPNLIISATTENKISQQLHYLVNKGGNGIYHLSSNDLIHHDDLFLEICQKLGGKKPRIKNVYHRNEDSYLALLPKINRFPKNYQITIQQVIDEATLGEQILTLRN